MKKSTSYPFEIKPLGNEDGGRFLISYPDFAESISDGETVGEASANRADALLATIAALKANKLPVPQPGSGGVASGKCATRVQVGSHASVML